MQSLRDWPSALSFDKLIQPLLTRPSRSVQELCRTPKEDQLRLVLGAVNDRPERVLKRPAGPPKHEEGVAHDFCFGAFADKNTGVVYTDIAWKSPTCHLMATFAIL